MSTLGSQTTIQVTTWSILKVFLILIGVWFLYQIREVLLIVFGAILLASILESPVSYLQKRRVPRAVGMVLIYLVLISLFAVLAIALIPPFVEQMRQLGEAFPGYIQKLWTFSSSGPFDAMNLGKSIQDLASGLAGGTTSNIFNTVTTFFGGFVSLIIVLVMTFYLVVEEDALHGAIHSITPEKYRPYLSQLFGRMQTKLGDWLRGQLILSAIIGVLYYTALYLIGVPYAVVLAILAALFEFVPYIGPITATIPALVIALALSPVQALIVLVAVVIIQQVENHILIPQIMRKAVGLNPVVSIVALLIGIKIGGILGGIVAIPAAAALSVFVQDIYQDIKLG